MLPTPSTDRMVWVGLASVTAVRAWTTASVPDRVAKANWWGWQAVWIGWAYFWARHRETSLRNTSPTTMPRTLPLGLVRATIRPRPMARAISAGILAWARWRATRMRLVVAVSSSIRMRRVSAVRPDGPGAAPLRALLKFMRMRSSGRSTGWSGWNSLSDGCRGRRAQGGAVLGLGVPAKCRLFRALMVLLSGLVWRRKVHLNERVGGLWWLDVRGLDRGSCWGWWLGPGDVPWWVIGSIVPAGIAQSERASHLC